MSKSRGNVVVPDDYVNRYGADAFRLYLLSMGPFAEGGDFRETGVNGPQRFLVHIFTLLERFLEEGSSQEPVALARLRHRCIRDVTRDTPELKYNTSIAAMMTFVKQLQATPSPLPRAALETLALLLAPFCPHAAEEIWARLGNPYSVHQQPWPEIDPQMLVQDQVVVVISINGKKRDQMSVAPGLPSSELQSRALASGRIQHLLEGRTPSKVFVVPDRQVNLVLPRD